MYLEMQKRNKKKIKLKSKINQIKINDFKLNAIPKKMDKEREQEVEMEWGV